MFHRCILLAALAMKPMAAAAMVGGAPAIEASRSRSEIMILSERGNLCTGIVLKPDLVLTAAHCIEPGAAYKFYELDAERKPIFYNVTKTVMHPQYSKTVFDGNRATPDLALLKSGGRLPARFLPVSLSTPRGRVAVGERFTIVGYGVTSLRDSQGSGLLRSADLIATGQPGNLQLRLFDPATRGEAPGLGACTGDSGGPVYEERDGQRLLYGVVSWTTGPKMGAGCGGLTGVTPLELYRSWVVDTARKLGSPIAP